MELQEFVGFLGVCQFPYVICFRLGGWDLSLNMARFFGSSFPSIFFGPYRKRGIVGLLEMRHTINLVKVRVGKWANLSKEFKKTDFD